MPSEIKSAGHDGAIISSTGQAQAPGKAHGSDGAGRNANLASIRSLQFPQGEGNRPHHGYLPNFSAAQA
jgi:hypothetical protein